MLSEDPGILYLLFALKFMLGGAKDLCPYESKYSTFFAWFISMFDHVDTLSKHLEMKCL